MSSPHFSIIFCGLQTILPGLPRSELSDGIPGMHVLCLTLFNYAISRAACAEWLAMYVWFLYVRKFCGIRSNDMQLLLLRCSFPNNPFTFHLETCLNVIRINANHREWVESFVPSFHCHILCALQTIWPSLDAVRTAREWCRVQVVLEVPLNGVQPSDIPYGLRKMVLSSTRQGTCIRTSIHHAHQLIHSQLSEVVFSGWYPCYT